jgi:hypothetical protein
MVATLCQRSIPTAYAQENARSVAVVKMLDDNADMEESDKVKKERNDMQGYFILNFVDRTRVAKKNLELYNEAFETLANQKNKALSKNHQWLKSKFKASGPTYTKTVYRTTFRKLSLQQTMVFVINVSRWKRKYCVRALQCLRSPSV